VELGPLEGVDGGEDGLVELLAVGVFYDFRGRKVVSLLLF
jgi:hypothetical protein